MTMHFAANDVHSTIYVVSGDTAKASAWIRAQEHPSKYRLVAPAEWPGKGATVVALFGTMDYGERNRAEDEAKFHRWHLRRVYG